MCSTNCVGQITCKILVLNIPAFIDFLLIFFIYHFVQAVLNAAVIDMSIRIVKGRFSSSHLSFGDIYLSAWQVLTCTPKDDFITFVNIRSLLLFGDWRFQVCVFSRKSNQRQFQLPTHHATSLSKARVTWKQHGLWCEHQATGDR